MTLSDLEKEFTNAIELANVEYRWYKRRKWRYMFLSWLIRGFAFALIVAGTVLPLVEGSESVYDFLGFKFPSSAHAGVASLVVAGLLIGANHVFLISGSWIRGINAMLRIETLKIVAGYDWRLLKSSIPDDETAHEKRVEVLSLFKKLVVDARAVSQHETESWGNELNQAIEKLQSMTDNSSEAAKAEMRAREEAVKSATKEYGAIVVEIEGYDKLQGVVVIKVGNRTIEKASPIPKTPIPNVGVGQQTVSVSAKYADGQSFRREDLVVVKSDSVEKIMFVATNV